MSELFASDLLDVLERTQFRPPAHAMLREVRNATGYSRFARTADALVISLWPSRGVWFGGVEVKVSRGDLLRELKDPDKSSAIQKYCNYWWIATPPGLAKAAEMPRTWGLVEVHGAKHKVIKDAPELAPEALHPQFVAAVLRNRASFEATLVAETTSATWRKARAELGSQENERLKQQYEHEKMRADAAMNELKQYHQSVAAFEQAAGVRFDRYDGARLGETVKLAQLLRGRDFGRLVKQLEQTTSLLRDAASDKKTGQS